MRYICYVLIPFSICYLFSYYMYFCNLFYFDSVCFSIILIFKYYYLIMDIIILGVIVICIMRKIKGDTEKD